MGSDSFPQSYDSSKPEDLPQDTIHGDQGSYLGTITGVPSAISGKAIAAKNAVASKLGYGGTVSPKSPESGSPASTGRNNEFSPESHPTDDSSKPVDQASGQGSYIGKMAGVVPSTITDKAIAAKNVVASKLGYGGTEAVKAPDSGARESLSSTGSNDQFTFAPESLPGSDSTPKAYDSSKPVDQASDQGSYIGKMAGVVPSTITDKAIAAKNVVASKLGYGGAESVKAPETGEFVGAEKAPSSTATITDKAIAAKNVVASKLGYGGTETLKAPETGEFIGAEKSPSSTATTPYMQGVASKVTGTLAPVTDYLSEKFRPGEDDQALSRDISDALHARKENLVKSGEPKVVGKVIDETEGEPKILAEAKKEGDDVKVAGPENVNKGVVNLVKETVSSWVGKGGGQQQQTQGSPKSHTTTEGQAGGEIEHPLYVPEEKKMD